MFYLDLFGMLFNVLFTFFLARLKIYSWFVGIMGALFTFVLYLHLELYSAVFLQVIFIIFYISGFIKWSRGLVHKKYPIKQINLQKVLYFLFIFLFLSITLILINTISHSNSIIFSGILTAMTITALIMTIYSYLENWLLWILADVLWLIINLQNGLIFHALASAIFCITAIYGFYYWCKNIHKKI